MGGGYAAFPDDPVLTQLRTAGDPAEMLQVFRDHLRPVAKNRVAIQDCQIARVRYRRGARCVLQYQLRLLERDTGREHCQWVTGVLYAQHRAERSWRKLEAANAAADIPAELLTFEPVGYISDLQMLVQVFPYDRRLPSLRLLIAGTLPELKPLFLARFGPGEWDFEECKVEPIRYRAQLCAVLRYTIKAREIAKGRMEAKRFYVKIYRDDEGARTFQTLKALSANTACKGEGFAVAEPVAYMPAQRALIQEEMPGSSLLQLLIEDRATTTSLHKIARALAILNQDDLAVAQRHTLQDEIEDIRRAGRLLQWCCPDLAAEVQPIVQTLSAHLQATTDEKTTRAPTHRDLKPEHILCNGDRLALVDLDSFAEAEPLLDPAGFLARLSGVPLRFSISPDRVRAAAQAFADQYFAHVPQAWRGKLDLRYAAALLDTAAGFFRNQEPEWPAKISSLVAQAKDALRGKDWS